MKVLILHGLGGSDSPHWQDWLHHSLIEKGIDSCFPQFPERDSPIFHEWFTLLEKTMIMFHPTHVVCHSMANFLWWHYRQKYDFDGITFWVAPPSFSSPIPQILPFIPPLTYLSYPQDKNKLILSTNDPYCSVEEGKIWEKGLGVNARWIENGGHLNVNSGYGKWKEIYTFLLMSDEQIHQ